MTIKTDIAYYDAVVFDNSILKANGYDFQREVFKGLNQFKDSKIIILRVDIVDQEAIKHLSENLKKRLDQLKTSLESIDALFQDIGMSYEYLKSARDEHSKRSLNAKEIAAQRIDNFYKSLNAEEIIASDWASSAEIIDMYFKNEPPFAGTGNKKCEFPDAFILIALQNWAEQEDKKILAVSMDRDWENFAKKSSHVTAIEDLGEAIAKLSPENQKENLKDSIEAWLQKSLDIEDNLQEHFNAENLNIDAVTSFYAYELEEVLVGPLVLKQMCSLEFLLRLKFIVQIVRGK